MTRRSFGAPWYHGSPLRLRVLAKGSMVTPFREIAKAFAHKPATVSMSDDCEVVRHDGTVPGFLYVVAEQVGDADLKELPGTASTHWQTQRELEVSVVCGLPVSDPPLLSAEEVERMRRAVRSEGRREGFTSSSGTDDPHGTERCGEEDA